MLAPLTISGTAKNQSTLNTASESNKATPWSSITNTQENLKTKNSATDKGCNNLSDAVRQVRNENDYTSICLTSSRGKECSHIEDVLATIARASAVEELAKANHDRNNDISEIARKYGLISPDDIKLLAHVRECVGRENEHPESLNQAAHKSEGGFRELINSIDTSLRFFPPVITRKESSFFPTELPTSKIVHNKSVSLSDLIDKVKHGRNYQELYRTYGNSQDSYLEKILHMTALARAYEKIALKSPWEETAKNYGITSPDDIQRLRKTYDVQNQLQKQKHKQKHGEPELTVPEPESIQLRQQLFEVQQAIFPVAMEEIIKGGNCQAVVNKYKFTSKEIIEKLEAPVLDQAIEEIKRGGNCQIIAKQMGIFTENNKSKLEAVALDMAIKKVLEGADCRSAANKYGIESAENRSKLEEVVLPRARKKVAQGANCQVIADTLGIKSWRNIILLEAEALPAAQKKISEGKSCREAAAQTGIISRVSYRKIEEMAFPAAQRLIVQGESYSQVKDKYGFESSEILKELSQRESKRKLTEFKEMIKFIKDKDAIEAHRKLIIDPIIVEKYSAEPDIYPIKDENVARELGLNWLNVAVDANKVFKALGLQEGDQEWFATQMIEGLLEQKKYSSCRIFKNDFAFDNKELSAILYRLTSKHIKNGNVNNWKFIDETINSNDDFTSFRPVIIEIARKRIFNGEANNWRDIAKELQLEEFNIKIDVIAIAEEHLAENCLNWESVIKHLDLERSDIESSLQREAKKLIGLGGDYKFIAEKMQLDQKELEAFALEKATIALHNAEEGVPVSWKEIAIQFGITEDYLKPVALKAFRERLALNKYRYGLWNYEIKNLIRELAASPGNEDVTKDVFKKFIYENIYFDTLGLDKEDVDKAIMQVAGIYLSKGTHFNDLDSHLPVSILNKDKLERLKQQDSLSELFKELGHEEIAEIKRRAPWSIKVSRTQKERDDLPVNINIAALVEKFSKQFKKA